MSRKNALIHVLVVICIAGAVLLCYGHTLEVPFVFDDQTSIVENQKIRDLDRFLRPEALTAQRPLADLTFACNYAVGELDVSGYHVVNIGIHIMSAWLVYVLALFIFRRLEPGGSPETGRQRYLVPAAAFAALVFALHPVQTQAVTYIVQRYTSLAAMFYLAAVLLYILGRQAMQQSPGPEQPDNGRGRWFLPLRSVLFFVLCLGCGMVSFLSKQNALSLPLAVLLVEYTLFERSWADWKRATIWIGPLFLLFAGFTLYSAGVFQGDISLAQLLAETDQRSRETMQVTRWQYLLTQFKVIPLYMGLLVWPVGQNVDYMHPFVTSIFQSWTVWGLLILLLVAGVGLWMRKREPEIFVGVFWFFIALSVESSIIPIKDAMFEHRLYLPMFGFALILGWIMGKMYRRRKLPALAVGLAVLGLLGTATADRNAVWENPTQLWAQSVDQNPENYRARYNYGRELARKGDIDKALEQFQEAIEIYPGHAKSHYNAGLAYQVRNNYKQALQHYHRAVEHDSGHVKARLNIATITAGRGDLKRAQKMLKEILQIEPNHTDALMNLGVISFNLNRPKQAMDSMKRVLKLEPKNVTALKNLGVMLMQQGRLDEAEDYLQQAYKLDPSNQGVRQQLSRLQWRKAQK